MLDIPLRKIANIILMAHELDRAQAELRSFIDALAEDEQASLVALMWVGRGSFEPEDLAEAKRTAMAEATTPTADYLLGTPHLADHLESGLEALGLSASQAQDDLMAGR